MFFAWAVYVCTRVWVYLSVYTKVKDQSSSSVAFPIYFFETVSLTEPSFFID